ncbi:MAG: tRNA preQ1(34) S-adenosylmethionine ribosyltransferase-isomerase QueA [Hyphomicrobiales bacterium]|nr:tRNA preQ1(34) S-adenosylmethionine ribosyltransferase-isomerase QueA [Hyphomicrobiales bacterium]MCP5371941.1 tRNA preQ1(34) S-adenosylmethionine ribosyltransferase-isomerase QueA [Hyphomicrobiales bacterium]
MRTDDFDFHLPADLIAQRPARPRDSARLLAVGDVPRDLGMRDLADCLRPGDLLVFNDTRVIPARLKGRRGAAGVEVTLHLRVDDATWRAFARPARKLKQGDVIDFADGFAATVAAKGDEGEVTLAFDRGGGDLMAALEAHGAMPLPPYIKRDGLADARDREDYQTLFAARDGAVAAPTAGLHFTPDMLSDLDFRGVRRTAVTLHVGAGTFLPVKAEQVADHRMHAEWGQVSPDTALAVNATRAMGGRIVAVGTTSLRLLESAADEDGVMAPFSGETDIFITPGYDFRVVDLLLTNFHLPRSTLFMLVCAFAGTATMKAAYAHAIAERYRFYSYGDGCLLERNP